MGTNAAAAAAAAALAAEGPVQLSDLVESRLREAHLKLCLNYMPHDAYRLLPLSNGSILVFSKYLIQLFNP